ncbi:hypothetical protein J22TS3_37290 [Paenibacillus sp. J22TS3]|nr:hypothetical protein J22TS3_37290 [Paenibacillus sp. J22TS3]
MEELRCRNVPAIAVAPDSLIKYAEKESGGKGEHFASSESLRPLRYSGEMYTPTANLPPPHFLA